MHYDFTTLPNRREQASIKWKLMLEDKDVPNGIVPLTTADMELKNPPEIVEGLKSFLDEMVLGYTYPSSDFINAFQFWMKSRHNLNVKPEWIVPTTGVVPAFFTAIRALTKKNDGVVIMPPVYPPFFRAVEAQKRKLLQCPLLCSSQGYYEIDFEHLEKIFKSGNAKVLLFCSPHNPVGRVWEKKELERLAELCLKYNVFILADEIHHDLVLPGHKHTVFQSLSPEVAKITITHTSLSKTFNLAGMMLSVNIISDKNVREKFNAELSASGSHQATALGYKAFEIAYTKCAAWLDQFLELIDKNQKLVSTELSDTKVKAASVEGTFLQWLDFRALKLSDEELLRFLHEKALLYLNEGKTFGKEGSAFARINLAAPSFVISEAMQRLKKALKEL